MLKNAYLYKDELQRKYQETIYNLKYQYYHGFYGARNVICLPDNTSEVHTFVSFDEEINEVVGYIAYNVDYAAKSAFQFGAINFDLDNPTFAKDIFTAIDDIFCKYKLNRIEFFCFLDNPIRKSYDRLVRKYGGRVVGVLYNNTVLLDGELHSTIIYEMTGTEYIMHKAVKNRK